MEHHRDRPGNQERIGGNKDVWFRIKMICKDQSLFKYLEHGREGIYSVEDKRAKLGSRSKLVGSRFWPQYSNYPPLPTPIMEIFKQVLLTMWRCSGKEHPGCKVAHSHHPLSQAFQSSLIFNIHL